jgi:hypothetical protein
VEYLSLLHGRPAPDDPAAWRGRRIDEIVDYIDSRAVDPAFAEEALARVAEQAGRFGLSLSADDVETIRRFHSEFIRQGMDLRFRSHGRRPRSYYPTYRQLVLETDLEGRQVSCFYTSNVEDYLLRERSFERYIRNVSRLPRDSTSMIVRSFFGRGFGYIHPQAVAGYHSVQLLQTIEGLLDSQAREAYHSYLDLVSRNTVEVH